jgi:anti-anti-sigma factor
MQIVHQLSQGIYDVGLSGKFTFSDHPAFCEILQRIGEEDVREVTFDMVHVEFIDSAGLGMLLLALDAVEKTQKNLVIRGARNQVKKMFDLAQFEALFTMN